MCYHKAIQSIILARNGNNLHRLKATTCIILQQILNFS
uniref:Uncharacterized protein n=1 Tax=Rhizophora mucronata TaxID=61149 RepID=A0A2P2R3T9_RHIMU